MEYSTFEECKESFDELTNEYKDLEVSGDSLIDLLFIETERIVINNRYLETSSKVCQGQDRLIKNVALKSFAKNMPEY